MTFDRPAAPVPPWRPTVAHVVATVVALVLCLALAQVAPMLTGWAAMSSVGSSATGAGLHWANLAMIMSLAGAYAIFGIVTLVAAWRLVRARRALGVAITGCVLQVCLLVIAVMMTGLVD